jgi:phospholipase/carboxylesterase
MSDFVYRYEPGSRPETLLLLHGTGGDENDLMGLGPTLLPGAGLLSPRGQVTENSMPRFFRRIAEGVFDEEDIKFRAAELGAWVKERALADGFDRKRVIALGYFNGANIAAAMLLLGDAQFSRAVLMRAMVPLIPAKLPDLAGTEVLLATGAYDPMATTGQTAKLRRLLEKAGATVSEHSSQTGHQLTQGDIEAAALWLARG